MALWQCLGLKNPHVMMVEDGRSLWLGAPTEFRNGTAQIEIDDEIDFSEEAQEPHRYDNQEHCRVDVVFHKVFLVKPSSVYHGCCRKYSLPKAVFLKMAAGGDPYCGGGIKHFWPPLWQRLLETLKLSRAMRKEELHALSDSRISVHEMSWIKEQHPCQGYLSIYVGDKKELESFAAQFYRSIGADLKPVKIKF